LSDHPLLRDRRNWVMLETLGLLKPGCGGLMPGTGIVEGET
jgi:hypothetical protein